MAYAATTVFNNASESNLRLALALAYLLCKSMLCRT
jgi:hypothetical protein